MSRNEYQQRIVDYYRDTEFAYRDSWDLDKSLSIHYGYWDAKVRDFPGSLLRMNEVMIEAASINKNDRVLDAGCGVGGSSIFIASNTGAAVTGITLSERQVQQATENAMKRSMDNMVNFEVRDYSDTKFPDASFDVVWGCESICYAADKEVFIREAFRLLKPGGRLVIADGMVTSFRNNDTLVIRRWLDGWQVNYLETAERLVKFMTGSGFTDIRFRDITKETTHSSRRLFRFYFLAKMYVYWRKWTGKKQPTALQLGNIAACKYQYKGLKKGLWQYGLLVGKKPS